MKSYFVLALLSALSPHVHAGWSLPGWVSNAGNSISTWFNDNILPASTANCPPVGFDALKNFDVNDYISAPWFVQWQMPNAYQPESSLYCGEFLSPNPPMAPSGKILPSLPP